MFKKLFLKLLGLDGPFNGWKTIAGLLLLLLAQAFPESSPEQQQLLVDSLHKFLELSGLVLTTIGAIHKAWKNLTRGGRNVVLWLLVIPFFYGHLAYADTLLLDTKVITVTPVLNADTNAEGDTMIDTTDNGGQVTIPYAGLSGKASGKVVWVTVADIDDQGGEFWIHLFDADPDVVSAEGDPLSISDATADSYICTIEVSTYVDLALNQLGRAENIGCAFDIPQDLSNTDEELDLYAVLEDRSASTRTASGLVLRFAIERD